MVIDIIPTESRGMPKWLNYLFYFLFGFLFLSLISLFILSGFLTRAHKSLSDLNVALEQETEAFDPELERDILRQKGRIEDFKSLIEGHSAVAAVFPLIQNLCHPEVWFTSFDFSGYENKVKLTGEAQNFESLGQQIFIFEEEPLIYGFDLGSLSITEEGTIKFGLSLSLGPEIPSLTNE